MKGDPGMYKKPAVWIHCLILVILWLPSITSADEESVPCIKEPYTGKLFAALYQTTEETARTLCRELERFARSETDRSRIDQSFIASVLKDFAKKSEQALDDLKLNDSAEYKNQFEAVKETFDRFDFKNVRMPELKIKRSVAGGYEGYFEPVEEEAGRFAIRETAHCAAVSPGASCKEIFDDFASAFNPYRSGYDEAFDTNVKLLEALGKRWDAFLDASKSQTFLEVWFTTLVNNEHFKKNHLVGPPDYQIIALHPQLVYDSMDKAPDGSNQELGLGVEWAGINFWDLTLWDRKLPLGVSLASIYVDRANVKDAGHGFMLHINNHYAVGWAKHSDASSIYVTIDLLKMFEEKKSQYDKYVHSYF
jgi:hypothetical protein